MGIVLFLLRILFLGLFTVFSTLYGLVVFPFFLRSKNKNYQLSVLLRNAAPVLGLRVESRFSTASTQVKQAVYISNHQNNADLFCLTHAVTRGVVTVGKKSLIWVPFFGVLYWISGNFLINRSNREKALATIDQIVKKMQTTHLSILMFPEGTRSRGRGLLPFKAGAFHAAIKAGVPIIPIVCSNTHEQVKLGRWNNGEVIVEVLDPISTKGLTSEDAPELMQHCHQIMHSKFTELNATLKK